MKTRRQLNESAFKKVRRKQAQIRGAQPVRDARYLRFLRRQPCCVCVHIGNDHQVHPTEAAHVGPRGLSQKAPDDQAVPLCAWHHRFGTDAHHVLGKRFEEHHGINLSQISVALRKRFLEDQA